MSFPLTPIFFLSLFVISLSANKMVQYCMKEIEECEKTPHVSECLIKNGCHRLASGTFPKDDVCNSVRRICADVVDACLEMLWDPAIHKGYICTHDVAL